MSNAILRNDLNGGVVEKVSDEDIKEYIQWNEMMGIPQEAYAAIQYGVAHLELVYDEVPNPATLQSCQNANDVIQW